MTVRREQRHEWGVRPRGFSLVEMLVALTVLALVIGALSTILVHATMSRVKSANRFESLQTARAALDLISRDLRSAGYGVDGDDPAGRQPAIAYVDSMQILMCENQAPYPDTGAAHAPEAYNPAGLPRPRPLVASSWTPPRKYGSGAEIIRYTLDLNDDGRVDASDIAAPEGADAQRTPQPDDYTLVREVYGDASGGMAGNNGGSVERIALVLRPGGSVPRLFDVYLGNDATPWDWSNGPVPANQLASITRIGIHISASSPDPDPNGSYTRTDLQTMAQLTRNTPDFANGTYTVDGYVYDDQNLDGTRQSAEPGVGGATVRFGSGRVVYTTSAGYFSFHVPSGSYTLKHVAAAGYGSFAHPDSFLVSVSGSQSFSFPDTACHGGWVNATAWDDANKDGVFGAGESPLSGVVVTLSPGVVSATTNVNGIASLFTPVGAWSIAASPPANFSLTTANPVTGTTTNGAAASIHFGFASSAPGSIAGTVFLDGNANGSMDGTDSGISGVVVTVTDAGGGSTIATGTTDVAGHYSLSVPENSAAAIGYTVVCAQVAGRFPTTGLAIANVRVGAGQAVNGDNFGFGSWSSVSIATGAVNAMRASDLWENDGATTKTTRGDIDLVVAYTNATGSAFSYWYNNYPASTFGSSPSVVNALAAPATVLWADSTWNAAQAADPPDVIVGSGTGTGNWGVWARKNATATPPTVQTKTFSTTNAGTVGDLLVYACAGSAYPDAIVGTTSTSPGTGSFEVWTGGTSGGGNYTSNEIYPTAGGISTLGEVRALAVGDIDNSGVRDLIVATQLGPTSGAVLVFQWVTKTKNNRFIYKCTIPFSSAVPVKLAATDVDGDGWNDLVIGTQTSSTTGGLLVYRNGYASSPWTFSVLQSINAPGAVTALAVGDLGGSAQPDVVLGYCSNSLNNAGGARIYYSLGTALATGGVDPSGGSLAYCATSFAIADFQNGTYPSVPSGPRLADLAIGWKQTATAGGILVLLR